MCGFFAWGGGGGVVAEFLLYPPTHKKSVTGNRVTPAPSGEHLTPSGEHLTPGAEHCRLTLKAKCWCLAVSL